MSARAEFDELMRPKGRRSAHPDDDDDRSFLHLSDDDDDEPEPSAAPPPRPSTNLSRSNIPTTRYDANTGPKGVIADAQNFRDSQRQHRSSLRTSSALSRAQQGGYSNSNSNSNGYGYGYNSGGHVGRQSPGTFSTSEKLSEAAEDADGLDDDDDELDDEGADDGEFMHKWRMTRLQELQMGGTAAAASKAHSRERGGSRRLWGGLATVDGGGFLDAVDRCPPGTVVVVYIYDDYSQVSSSIEACVRALAAKHLDTRFIKLHYADAEMEPAGVPALLAYRDGDKFAGLVPVLHEIPDDAELSAAVLESVLRRHQILR